MVRLQGALKRRHDRIRLIRMFALYELRVKPLYLLIIVGDMNKARHRGWSLNKHHRINQFTMAAHIQTMTQVLFGSNSPPRNATEVSNPGKIDQIRLFYEF